jgi:hypothetical protein
MATTARSSLPRRRAAARWCRSSERRRAGVDRASGGALVSIERACHQDMAIYRDSIVHDQRLTGACT